MALDQIPLLLVVKEVDFVANSRATIVCESVNGVGVGKLQLDVPAAFAETVRPGDNLGGRFKKLTSLEVGGIGSDITTLITPK